MKKQVCTRCVLDRTIPEIEFDENGVCNYCKIYDELEKKHPGGKVGKLKIIYHKGKIKYLWKIIKY